MNSRLQKRAQLQKYANAAAAVLVKRALYKQADNNTQPDPAQTQSGQPETNNSYTASALKALAPHKLGIGIGGAAGASIPLINYLLSKKKNKSIMRLLAEMGIGGVGGSVAGGLASAYGPAGYDYLKGLVSKKSDQAPPAQAS